jgi:RNA polymerase sigma factor (sigma-70 family)
MDDAALRVPHVAGVDSRLPARAGGSKRLLGLAGDERLVQQIRCGNDAAFEVAFERHGPAILAFCRHMLGSSHEAEDAVQHTFAAAYRDLQRHHEREIALKPWLFAIARNRCLSLLRGRRDHARGEQELATAGLAEQVERRAELRELLSDLGDLPEEQRAALLLAEAGDLAHAQVAHVLGCEVHRVKALVHRARTGLIARRVARETPCEQIREQLANLRGGSLRRTELRFHLRECPDCRAYREHVKQQRQMLAAALPVAPTLALKSSVLAAVGIGGGAAGGGMAAALGGTIGSATLAKMAVVGMLAGGGALAGDAVIDSQREPLGTQPPAPAASGATTVTGAGGSEQPAGSTAAAAAGTREQRGERLGTTARDRHDGPPVRGSGSGAKAPPAGRVKTGGGRKPGHERPPKAKSNRGRGPIEAPAAPPPVERGPAEPKPRPAKPAPKGKTKAVGVVPPAPTAAEPITPGPKAAGPKK